MKNLVPEEILLKIKKVQTLAEKGEGAEKITARKLLESICDKYNVTLKDLDDNEKYWYSFEVRGPVVALFVHVYTSQYGAIDRHQNETFFNKERGGFRIDVLFTPTEYIEFSQLWEWHRKNFLAERKKIRETFRSGYLIKHKLLPDEIADKYKKPEKEMTEEESTDDED